MFNITPRDEELENLRKKVSLFEELYDYVVKERNKLLDQNKRYESYIKDLEESVRYLTHEASKGV